MAAITIKSKPAYDPSSKTALPANSAVKNLWNWGTAFGVSAITGGESRATAARAASANPVLEERLRQFQIPRGD
jgi:hypothetical protein